MPIVSVLAGTAKVVVPQPTLTKAPQVPENTCILGVWAEKLAPTLLSVMVGLVDWAVNLYQTSYLTVPAQAAGTPAAVNVALATVPAVLVQAVPDVRVTALAHKSFAGACAETNLPITVKSNKARMVLLLYRQEGINIFMVCWAFKEKWIIGITYFNNR